MTSLVKHAVNTWVYVDASICAKSMSEKIGFGLMRENLINIKGVELLNYKMELLKESKR